MPGCTNYILLGLGCDVADAVALDRGFGVRGMRPWVIYQLDRCGKREIYHAMQRGGTRRKGDGGRRKREGGTENMAS